jgi:hypothetical protein
MQRQTTERAGSHRKQKPRREKFAARLIVADEITVVSQASLWLGGFFGWRFRLLFRRSLFSGSFSLFFSLFGWRFFCLLFCRRFRRLLFRSLLGFLFAGWSVGWSVGFLGGGRFFA